MAIEANRPSARIGRRSSEPCLRIDLYAKLLVVGCRVQGETMRGFLGLGPALALVLFCHGAGASELRVTVDGVASSSGTLMVGLYDSEDHFRSATANAANLGLRNDRSRLVGIAMRAVAGTQSVVFTTSTPADMRSSCSMTRTITASSTRTRGRTHGGRWVQQRRRRVSRAAFLQEGCREARQSDRAITITLKYPRMHHVGRPDID